MALENVSPIWNGIKAFLEIGGLFTVGIIVAAVVIHGLRLALRLLLLSFKGDLERNAEQKPEQELEQKRVSSENSPSRSDAA